MICSSILSQMPRNLILFVTVHYKIIDTHPNIILECTCRLQWWANPQRFKFKIQSNLQIQTHFPKNPYPPHYPPASWSIMIQIHHFQKAETLCMVFHACTMVLLLHSASQALILTPTRQAFDLDLEL